MSMDNLKSRSRISERNERAQASGYPALYTGDDRELIGTMDTVSCRHATVEDVLVDRHLSSEGF